MESILLLTADRIHNGREWMPESTVLAVEKSSGIIKAILLKEEIDKTKIKKYRGTLCPGFVNAHCHLELSHMKGKIKSGGGLIDFLTDVSVQRDISTVEEKQESIKNALEVMHQTGIVAIGDIANTSETSAFRQQSPFHMHTFVECLGFVPEGAILRWQHARKIMSEFEDKSTHVDNHIIRQSLTPHSPYSVSQNLFKLINDYATDSLISIHNEESMDELLYFYNKTGGMQRLFERLKINDSHFEPSRITSLQTYWNYVSDSHPIILVHNTFMPKEDIVFLQQSLRNTTLCLCPQANLYIENRLPDIQLFLNSGLNICLGTDSLASNYSLNIYEEIICIQQYYQHLSMEMLLRWACYNGAKALQMEHRIGSFQIGYNPGIVYIDEVKGISKRLI